MLLSFCKQLSGAEGCSDGEALGAVDKSAGPREQPRAAHAYFRANHPFVWGCLQGSVARISASMPTKAKRAGRCTHESYHRHNEHPSAQRRAPHAIAAPTRTEITRPHLYSGGAGIGITALDRA